MPRSKRCASASQGNPLYARELVIGAVAGGHLRNDRGVWRLVGPLEATARLSDAIAARLDVPDPEARAALERTALWEPVGLSTLEAAVGAALIERLEPGDSSTSAEPGDANRCASPTRCTGRSCVTTWPP